ncbi:unnamed protein product [Psylliodes chrysocephalus]|uniref:Regulatory protein zeste n=1 Tax=Psylliodes chrysocephalus TaxID=3402493 RepID=A0A9P0GIJ7_9CUCU|nr:unnamed protein product [Psylliodes chrysocephala]
MYDKNKRVNYALEERRVLTELVEKYKDIIENKETNAGSNLQKDQTLKAIEKLFNSKNVNVYRDASSLRKQWAHIKMETRKKAALERQEMYTIGGGTLKNGSCSSTNNDDLVLSIVNNKIITGLENPYDSDAIVIKPIEPEIVNINEISSVNIIGASEVLSNANTENLALPTEEQKSEKNEKKPRWSAKRRPKLEKIGPVEKAKIEVLHAQRDQILQEIEMKKKLFDLEYEHKKKCLNWKRKNCKFKLYNFFFSFCYK